MTTIPRPKFEVDQWVKIVPILDDITTRSPVGKEGVVREIDPLSNGDFNYFVSCPDGRRHYVREEELEAEEENLAP